MPDRLRSFLRQMFASSSADRPPLPRRRYEPRPQAILYRILGPDLPGIQPSGMTVERLRFILEQEPILPGLEKRWLLNRLSDSEQRQALISLLNQHKQIWCELPFEPESYLNCWTDSGAIPDDFHPWSSHFSRLDKGLQLRILDYVGREKSLYLLNANAARNHALTLGWRDARWVFPWDGNCFLSLDAWRVIRQLLRISWLAYIAVPTTALDDGPELLAQLAHQPLAEGIPLLGIARQATPPFNPQRRRDSGSVSDLPCRLGLMGVWRQRISEPCPWEAFDTTPLADRSRLAQAGWAYLLPPLATVDLQQRQQAIWVYARNIDKRLLGEAMERHPLRCWTGLLHGNAPTSSLAVIAANARSVPPPSVTEKPEVLPGTNERSYVNAVAHWQSVAGDGADLSRVALLAGAGPLCGDVAQHYDRARLQLMIDCVCSLSLDGDLNENRASLDHAVRMVQTWFIDPVTAMIPDGAYARLSAVDTSRNVLEAAIDFRDFYPLLDALTLLQRKGCFSLLERQQIDEWLDAFLAWLAADSGSFLQHHSTSPACTWYHLLMLAIATFRGRRTVVAQVFDNLPGLLAKQFRADGSPRSSEPDARLRHEHLFNLQAWTNLSLLSSTLGRDLMAFNDSHGIGLLAIFAHARDHLPVEEPPLGSGELSALQWLRSMEAMVCHQDASASLAEALPPLAEASTGLPPFWNHCRILTTR